MLRNSAINWYLVANFFETERQKKNVLWKKITCTLIYSTPAVGAASCSMQASFAVLLSIQGWRKRKPPDLKFGPSEKGTKIEKNLPFKIWRYWITSNRKWKIFSNFVLFSDRPKFSQDRKQNRSRKRQSITFGPPRFLDLPTALVLLC